MGIARRSIYRRAGDEKSRSFDFATLKRLALRDRPIGVVVRIRDGCHTVVQEHRRHVFAKMDMGIDQAGKYGLSLGTHHARAGRITDFAFCSDPENPRPCDYNNRIVDGIPSRAVDQGAAFQDQSLAKRGSMSSRDKSQNHKHYGPLSCHHAVSFGMEQDYSRHFPKRQ